MRALVVYETIWGNTGELAAAVAEGLRAGAGVDEVDLVEAADAPAAIDPEVDLLVVGGPTHAFSMTTGSTRESARQQGATRIPARGIREWLEQLAPPASAVAVATFDTRTVAPRLPGSAAKKALKRLVAKGFRPVDRPATFGVHGYSGPIADGELERARAWGATLIDA
ncbi:flavodoxin family protein [Agromyces aurantiacus]|uniref:Flavodoxin family protein n=1 Tax=Agromyces aurantiacus TaxID=165814 RepID=A0ABV9R312_9MICO|nr:flavodoxin domain-containing protein [Agromyces aurantiacus]MBM7503164.1 menaquinone-dependent protoporphyrinogen IX oxidase [Agromyces aurantiacus]